MAFNYFNACKLLIYNPHRLFSEVLAGKHGGKIISAFAVGVVHTFLSSIERMPWPTGMVRVLTQRLDIRWFSQLDWLLPYLFFSFFVFCLSQISRRLGTSFSQRAICLTLMSPAIVGVPVNVVSNLLCLVIDGIWRGRLSYLFLGWTFVISILAVRKIFGGSTGKTVLVYSSFGFLVFVLAGVIPWPYPYLLWIRYPAFDPYTPIGALLYWLRGLVVS